MLSVGRNWVGVENPETVARILKNAPFHNSPGPFNRCIWNRFICYRRINLDVKDFRTELGEKRGKKIEKMT